MKNLNIWLLMAAMIFFVPNFSPFPVSSGRHRISRPRISRHSGNSTPSPSTTTMSTLKPSTALSSTTRKNLTTPTKPTIWTTIATTITPRTLSTRRIQFPNRKPSSSSSLPTKIHCYTMWNYLKQNNLSKWWKQSMTNRMSYEIPEIVLPYHYRLRLKIDMERRKLYGYVQIDIRIQNKTNLIELNGSGTMKILSATFRNSVNTIKIDATMVYRCPETETLVLQFPRYLYRGNANLAITYVIGDLQDLLDRGVLRSFFENHHQLTMIDLGPTDARRLFPCWDEPRFRATFQLHLLIPIDSKTFSNDRIVRRHRYSSTLDEVKFHTTTSISSYQLAAIFGPQLRTVPSPKNMTNVQLRVVTSDQNDNGQWLHVLNTGEYLLGYFQYYFDKPYPGQKLDLVALRHYQQISMEKLGLIYFSSEHLSVPNDTTLVTERELQQVAGTMAHSLAHQWIGNGVGFRDWSLFWLFESLNQFLEKQAMDDVFPHWRTWEQFTADEISLALRLDASVHAKPVTETLRHPENISMLYPYGANVYRKSTFLFRMLQSNLGYEIFQRGIQIFIEQHWNKTSMSSNDLWTAFLLAIDQIDDRHHGKYGEFRRFQRETVHVCANWTALPGYPVLHVEERQEGRVRVLKISQERFYELQPKKNQQKNIKKQIWPIPISVIQAFNPFEPTSNAVLNEERKEFRIPGIWNGEWIKLNPWFGQFYRVHYPESMLERFSISIEEKLLPPIDRLNLLDDLFAMIRSGYHSAAFGLKFIKSFENEDNPNIWSIIISWLTDIDTMISNHQANEPETTISTFQEKFRFYCQKLLKRMYYRIGWYEDGNFPSIGYKMRIVKYAEQKLRAKILCAMGRFNYENFTETARIKYEDYIHGESDLPIEILQCVFRSYSMFENFATNNNDPYRLEYLFEYYTQYDIPESRHLFAIALGSTQRPEEIVQVLQFCLKPVVEAEHAQIILLELSRNSRIGRRYVLTALTGRFFQFMEIFSTLNEFFEFLRALVETFGKRSDLTDLDEKILNNKTLKSIGSILETSLLPSMERLDIMERWWERDRKKIEDYLMMEERTSMKLIRMEDDNVSVDDLEWENIDFNTTELNDNENEEDDDEVDLWILSEINENKHFTTFDDDGDEDLVEPRR